MDGSIENIDQSEVAGGGSDEAVQNAMVGSVASMRDLIAKIFLENKTALSADEICSVAARYGLLATREATPEEVEDGTPEGVAVLVLGTGFKAVVEMIEQSEDAEEPEGDVAGENGEPSLASG